MRKQLHIAAVLLFGMIVMSASCHTPMPSGPPVSKKIPSLSDSGITGSWRWLYSIGGFSGRDSLSPNNSGYNLKTVFTNDSLFSLFRNDTLIETSNYHVFLGDSTEYYPWQITFRNISLTQFNRGFGAYEIPSSITLNADTLIIVANTTDSYSEAFVLIQ